MRKNVIQPYRAINAQSMGANVTSDTVNITNVDVGSIVIEWSAGSSPVGTIEVDGRLKKPDALDASTGWVTLDFGSTISISGASGNHQLIFRECPYSELRVRYVRSSGSGTLSAVVFFKQVGG